MIGHRGKKPNETNIDNLHFRRKDYSFYPGKLCKDVKTFPIPEFIHLKRCVDCQKKLDDSTNQELEQESKKRKLWHPTEEQIQDAAESSTTKAKPKVKPKPKKKPLTPLHIESFARSTEDTIIPEDEESYDIMWKNEKAMILNRKKLKMNEETEQDEYFWIVLQGTKKDDAGYLHYKDVTWIIQEVLEGFIVLKRDVLREYIYSRIPLKGKRESDPNESIYKRFGIGRRRETLTLIPRKDLEESEAYVSFIEKK